MFIHKGILDNAKYISLNHWFKNKKCMWAIAWSLNGEYWYHRDPSVAKFFRWKNEKGKKELYIGKYAFCFRINEETDVKRGEI